MERQKKGKMEGIIMACKGIKGLKRSDVKDAEDALKRYSYHSH
jgi:hypothetical protein